RFVPLCWRAAQGPICVCESIRGRRPRHRREEPMTRSVSDVFIETLVAAGVRRVYGVVGDSLNGLTDVIRKNQDIEWLHVRHEEVAAFAAGADAHVSGQLAVC